MPIPESLPEDHSRRTGSSKLGSAQTCFRRMSLRVNLMEHEIFEISSKTK